VKVGIVGTGLVGATAAYSLVMRGIGREIVLVDRDMARARAEADDISHAVPFAHPLTVRAGGYDSLDEAAVVVVAAGVSQRPGEDRMELLGRNAAVFAEVIPAVVAAAPNATLVIASNPVDVMTHVAAAIAQGSGTAPGCVFGTGTTLDTARLRTLIAEHVGVDAQHVHAYVLGEHGDSEVLAWSSVTIGGLPLAEFCASRGVTLGTAEQERIDAAVRRAAYRIIEGKGATYYGVGSAIARIVDTVLSDRRSVLTVCAPAHDVLGISNVTVSLPRLVGGRGVLATLDPHLNVTESAALKASAQAVKVASDSVDAAL